MADQTALANRPETGMERVKGYLLSPEVKERFTDMMGANGIYYLNQVLILVANDPKLQECSPKSILISAMRAASLRLSVDPGQGQAWIIPYKGVATFQLGYKGVYELAMRTGLYRFINDKIEVFEGEQVIEDRMTGQHKIVGTRTGNKIIGRMLYFQLLTGFEKTFYMTVEEIEAHARHYSKAYANGQSKWNDPYERPKMERKTVLVNGLRKWGRFNQGDADLINEIENEQGWIDRGELPEENQVTTPIKVEKTPEQIKRELGYDADPETGEVKPKPEPAIPPLKQDPAPAVEKPAVPPLRYLPEQLKARIAEIAEKSTGQVSNGKRGVVINAIEAALSMTPAPDKSRHQLLVYLTGHASSKDIPDNFIIALYKWLNPTQDSGGAWMVDAMSTREAIAAFNACQPPQDGLF
jgi:recombination protein RecT